MAEDSTDASSSKPHAWTQNYLVLDTVFTFLPLKDLREARLTCKEWADFAGRELARRTVVCVTDSTFAEFADFHKRRLRESCVTLYLWECRCFRERFESKKFISLDSSYIRDQFGLSSEFNVKNVDVLGYDSIRKLQQPMFSNLQNLQLIKIPFFQVSSLIQEVPVLYPNLKHLAFREIDVKALQLPEDYSRSTLQTLPTTTSNLESLTLEVSPFWTESQWDVLRGHGKLKKLAIIWFKNYVRKYHRVPDVLSDRRSYYGRFLQSLRSSAKNIFAGVTDVTLRFDLTPENAKAAQDFLNQFSSLSKLDLQLRGSFAMVQSFIEGLKPCVVAVVASIGVADTCWMSPEVMSDFNQLFVTLALTGYFQRPTWSFTFRAFHRGWLRFVKTDKKFMIQTQGSDMTPSILYSIIQGVLGHKDYFPNSYNYSYHNIVGRFPEVPINDYENFNESALFKSFFLRAGWRGMQHCVCKKTCWEKPRFLADLPGFHQEAGHSFSNDHPIEFDVRTWTFLFVPRHILAKWKLELVDEMAKHRRKSCRCRRLDFVGRMELGWRGKWSFTNSQGVEYPKTVLSHKNYKKLAYMSSSGH